MTDSKDTLPATVLKLAEREGEAILKPIGETLARITEKVYDDALTPSMKVVGELLGDGLAILGLAPKYARMKGEAFIADALSRVPEDRRTKAPLQLLGQTIEHARYHHPGTPLYEMFAGLLASGFDEEKQEIVHPAFPGIVSQLSPDEARVLSQLNDGCPIVHCDQGFHPEFEGFVGLEKYEEQPEHLFTAPSPVFPRGWRRHIFWMGTSALHSPAHMELYFNRLDRLGLLQGFVSIREDVHKSHSLILRGVPPSSKTFRFFETSNTITLSQFGQMLVDACVPKSPEWNW